MMSYTQFTPEMRKTHTILVPNMLPIHFQLLISIFGQYGYHMKLLESSSRTVVEEGLKNVHNDTCYPALLVIGALTLVVGILGLVIFRKRRQPKPVQSSIG